MTKRVAIPVPVTILPTVKLLVLHDLQLGDVIYSEGDVIEVFHHEAVDLVTENPDYFEVVTS